VSVTCSHWETFLYRRRGRVLLNFRLRFYEVFL
jgi:hypothetical protein